jgi:hypothetical protein
LLPKQQAVAGSPLSESRRERAGSLADLVRVVHVAGNAAYVPEDSLVKLVEGYHQLRVDVTGPRLGTQDVVGCQPGLRAAERVARDHAASAVVTDATTASNKPPGGILIPVPPPAGDREG